MKEEIRQCRFCGDDLPNDRPYNHCKRPICVNKFLSERRSNMGIRLLPKQNFEYTWLDDPDLDSGRSSGK